MQDSKALAMLNLVDFRYKAESIKDTSYRKRLEIYAKWQSFNMLYKNIQ